MNPTSALFPPTVVGMFTVIRGVENLWLPLLGGLAGLSARGLPALLAMAFGTALGANLLNNVPVTAALIGVLRHTPVAEQQPLALALVLGANLGPTVTPFGSLANATTACSICSASRVSIGRSSTPSDGATAWIAPNCPGPTAVARGSKDRRSL